MRLSKCNILNFSVFAACLPVTDANVIFKIFVFVVGFSIFFDKLKLETKNKKQENEKIPKKNVYERILNSFFFLMKISNFLFCFVLFLKKNK